MLTVEHKAGHVCFRTVYSCYHKGMLQYSA